MSKKKSSPKKLAKTAWWCESCQSGSMSHQRMMVHLEEKHGMDAGKLKCKRSAVSHIDGGDYFQTVWNVEVGGLKLVCSEICPRDRNDHLKN